MMNEMIEKMVETKGAEMAQGLVTKLGLSEEQARKFVPPAVKFLVGWVGKKLTAGEDVENAAVAEDEVQELAQQTGVEPSVASSAIAQLLPTVLGAAKDEAGGLGGLTSLLGNGGNGLGAAAGALKGMFG